MKEIKDLRVKKSKAGGYLDGPFFVKEFSLTEMESLTKKDKEDPIEYMLRLTQKSLVYANGENVFKPQQVKLINDRISGIQINLVCIHANGINDPSSMLEAQEEYKKNSSSGQSLD